MVSYWVSYKTVIFNKKLEKFRICLQNLFVALSNLKRFRRKKDLIAGTRSDPLKVPWIFLFFFWNFQHICKLFVTYPIFLRGLVKFCFFYSVPCTDTESFTNPANLPHCVPSFLYFATRDKTYFG